MSSVKEANLTKSLKTGKLVVLHTFLARFWQKGPYNTLKTRLKRAPMDLMRISPALALPYLMVLSDSGYPGPKLSDWL